MRVVTLIFAFCLVASVARPVAGDVLKIETNRWDDRRPLTWSAVLERINPETRTAHFTVHRRGDNEDLAVHVSRLYSLEFDQRRGVEAPFPDTRQELSTELQASNPNKTNIIVLRDDFLASELIPDEVFRKPAGQGKFKLIGYIVAADPDSVVVEARTVEGDTSQFRLDRVHLYQWIRGR